MWLLQVEGFMNQVSDPSDASTGDRLKRKVRRGIEVALLITLAGGLLYWTYMFLTA